MTREEEIQRLYTHGWAEKPAWAEAMHWKHPLWAYSDQAATEVGLRAYCQSMKKWVTPDSRIVGPDGSPYLDRYCLAESREAEAPFSKIYLNHFLRSDGDQALHSHPWGQSLSLILLNGYEEERRARWRAWVHKQDRYPGDVIEILADTFHRIDLYDRNDAWTLFFAGRYVGTWYFWDRKTGEQEQWEDYLRARGRLS